MKKNAVSMFLTALLSLFVLTQAVLDNAWSAPTKIVQYVDSTNSIGIHYNYDNDKKVLEVSIQMDQYSRSYLSPHLLKMLQKEITVVINGAPINLVPVIDSSEKVIAKAQVSVALPEGAEIKTSLWGKQTGHFTYSASRLKRKGKDFQLTAHDIRQFSAVGSSFASIWKRLAVQAEDLPVGPVADLHQHFAGALTNEIIVKVALKHNMLFPVRLLKTLNIDVTLLKISSEGREPSVRMRDIPPKARQLLKEALSLNPFGIESFAKMEEVYALRAPLVKAKFAFADYLWELARLYKKQGVTYAEQSLSDITDPSWLEIGHQVLPEIERVLGVTMPFTVGLWRHNPVEYNLALVQRIVDLKSPFIVGGMIMGLETNSSLAVEPVIKALVKAKEVLGKEFQVEVHAGENPYHLGNVKNAIDFGADRIGHGLFADQAALDLAIERGVVIEGNGTSNATLNNNDSVECSAFGTLARDPRYKCTISDDGGGLYSTDLVQEYRNAILMGLSYEDLRRISLSDKKYVERMKAFIQRRTQEWGIKLNHDDLPPIQFSDAQWNQVQEQRKEVKKEVRRALHALGITNQHESLDSVREKFKGMRPLLISAASMNSWPKIPEAERAQLVEALERDMIRFASMLRKKFYLLHGLTNWGYEAEDVRINNQHNLGISIVGTTPDNPDELQNTSDGKIDLTKMAEKVARVTDVLFMGWTWFDKGGALIPFVTAEGGASLYVAGGGVIRDEAQMSGLEAERTQGRHKFSLMQTTVGASHDLIPRYPEHALSIEEGLAGFLARHFPVEMKEFLLEEARSKAVTKRSGTGMACAQIARGK